MKFNGIKIEKQKLCSLKGLMTIDGVYIVEILIYGEKKWEKKDLKHLSGYKNDKIVKKLCIMLSKMNGHLKSFDETENTRKFGDMWVFGLY